MASYRTQSGRNAHRTSLSRSRQIALANARYAARRRAANECKGKECAEEDEDKDNLKERIEEARRIAARKAMMRRLAQEKVKKDDEKKDEKDDGENKPPADIEPEQEDEKDEDKEKEARRRAARRAALVRRARMKRKAQEVSDDLTGPDGDSSHIQQLKKNDSISDDLVETDEEKGGVQQTPPPSVDEAEDKVIAAYNLIEKQIAQNVISANVRKASLAAEYVKKYSAKEMKFAAEQLSKVGSAGKVAGGVRFAKRSALPAAKPSVKTDGGMDSQCLFF